MIKVGIIGATGYAGGELVRLLMSHQEAEIKWFGSKSYIDKKYYEVYQNFFQIVDDKCLDDNMYELSQMVDVIFTATPQGYCSSLMSEEILSKSKVIDLSADFRIKDVTIYEKWYGIHHNNPKLIEEAVYGLCEINRNDIKSARLVANTCTGAVGMGYCKDMAVTAGSCLKIPAESVLVASTGLIGKQIPIDKIKLGIQNLVPILGNSLEDGVLAAEAILTTDTKKKEMAVTIELGGKPVVIGGMCKGSGMIHPNMCTMLSFITTDAAISKELLQEALSADIKDTYNMISVDGDTSTNDTVLLLANGMAENPEITEKNEDYEKFYEALNFVNTFFAKRIAEDGEGATSLFEVKIINAKDKEQAIKLSKSIVSSNLTKAAIFGRDLNWGRILCAMGYSGAEFNPDEVDLYFESEAGKIKLIEDGIEIVYRKEIAVEILSKSEITITADVKMGCSQATAWGCDLTYDYIRINAAYGS